MPRNHRHSYVFPMPGSALLNAWREGYTLSTLKRDVMAGLTIGVVAVPLSMALAMPRACHLNMGCTPRLLPGR